MQRKLWCCKRTKKKQQRRLFNKLKTRSFNSRQSIHFRSQPKSSCAPRRSTVIDRQSRAKLQQRMQDGGGDARNYMHIDVSVFNFLSIYICFASNKHLYITRMSVVHTTYTHASKYREELGLFNTSTNKFAASLSRWRACKHTNLVDIATQMRTASLCAWTIGPAHIHRL